MQHKTRHKLSPSENKTTQEDTLKKLFFKTGAVSMHRKRANTWSPFKLLSEISGSLISERRKQLEIQIKLIIYSFSYRSSCVPSSQGKERRRMLLLT